MRRFPLLLLAVSLTFGAEETAAHGQSFGAELQKTMVLASGDMA